MFKRRVAATFELMATLHSLGEIRKAIAAQASTLGIERAKVYGVILAVEEACSNVIRHAYENGHARPLSLKIETTPKQIKIVLRDVGKPFDFDSYPSEITAQQALVARARGGYGVHLIKSLMDEYSYVRSEKGENNLQLIKNFKQLDSPN